MLELADNGRWPPANRPTRRYYAGKNTMEGDQISPGAYLVDRANADLWADFGIHAHRHRSTAIGGPALPDSIELLQEARRHQSEMPAL
jgi:hypothetical protein